MSAYITPYELMLFARLGSCPPSDFPHAGEWSDVTYISAGNGIVSVDGYPIDAFQVSLKFEQEGLVGASKFRYSLYQNSSYSRLYETKNRFEILDTGIMLVFEDGIGPTPGFLKGDTYSFSTTKSPELDVQIRAASDELDSYFGCTYNLPLLEWGFDVKRHCAALTRFHLMVNRGVREADLKTYETTYNQSLAWAKEVALGNLPISVKESEPHQEFGESIKPRTPFKPTAWRF